MVALYCGYVGLNAANPAVLAALERRSAARKAAARPALSSRHGAASAHMADSAMVGCAVCLGTSLEMKRWRTSCRRATAPRQRT